MSRFTITLTLDEIAAARRAAQKRGDTGPKRAIAEKAISLACRRRWEGTFQKLERWDTWKKVGKVPSSLEARLVESTVAGIELVDGTPDDEVIVLVGGREAPVFVILGWAFAGDVQQDKYWRETDQKFVMPHADLRSPWQLKRERRSRGRRLNPNDPADDFAGHGPWPGMFDTDDGRHPKHYCHVRPSKWALPCRRCQRIVPAGALSGWSPRTGWIHGNPKECGFRLDDDD